MDFLIRLVQIHETFRLPEIQALADLADIRLEIVAYNADSPFLIVRLQDEAQARELIRRSVLSKAVYELGGSGDTYPELHQNVQRTTLPRWRLYQHMSFRFDVDTYQAKRNTKEQRELIESFKYLDCLGPIKMKNPEQEFCIFEDWDFAATHLKRVHLGRRVGVSNRNAIQAFDLKKRNYISTTSMDSELALVTANITLAGPGKLFYDPFVGTGSFPIACAHYGAVSLGSDIDGRSIRGKEGKNLLGNFVQYGLVGHWLDGLVADLTNTPMREGRYLDGIICDPPYGVREGLKVLGSRDADLKKQPVYINGLPAHQQEGFVPPKRPYSFLAMLDDILEFAATLLVDNGRLSLWMPTANDDLEELAIPSHPCLEVVSICVQPFNKWSRRLLTYRRLSNVQVGAERLADRKRSMRGGERANDLNPFRKRYFESFKPLTESLQK